MGCQKMKITPHRIEAVYDEDLESVLRDLDLYEGVVGGSLRCNFCGKAVTIDNLQFIFSKNGEIGVSCDNPNCIERLGLGENNVR